MSSAILFIMTGFEETEALTTADILRRGGVKLTIVSLTEELDVVGSHGITVRADEMFERAIQNDYDMLILPGGPGAADYRGNDGLRNLIYEFNDKEKYISAICAAPIFLGELGLLRGKEALCYPLMQGELTELGARLPQEDGMVVVTDGRITTSVGPGTTVFFALRLLELLEGFETSTRVRGEFIA